MPDFHLNTFAQISIMDLEKYFYYLEILDHNAMSV